MYIEIRIGVAIICGVNSAKSKGHLKFAARDIVVEIFIDVRAQKFKEEFVDMKSVQRVVILLKDASQQGGVCHGYKYRCCIIRVENTRHVEYEISREKAYILTEETVVQESPYVCIVRKSYRAEFGEQRAVAGRCAQAS